MSREVTPVSPLDRQVIEVRRNGRNELVPALDRMWMTPITYLDYIHPVEGMDLDLWLERMKLLEQDLQWLLRIPYNKFWSQVIYDEALHYAVDSYLNFAPRYYDVPTDDGLNGQIQEMQDSLHRLFFMFFLRISVFKETKSRFITPAVFGEILYDNFVFDIPKLMDISVLYGRSNRELCEVMIRNIFQCQEKYIEDLTNSIPDIGTAFTSILENLQLSNDLQEPAGSKAGPSHQTFNGYEPISLDKLLDVSFYLLDSCGTLLSFMEIYPPCVYLFHKENFAEKIGGFYETVVPFLLKEFKKHKQQESTTKIVTEAFKRLSVIRNFLLKIFHQIVTTCCLNPVLETADLGIKNACCEDFLEIFMNLLAEKTFIVDYQKRYPIGEDLYLFRQANVQMDESRTSFLEECIKDMVTDCAKPVLPKTSGAPKVDAPTSTNLCYQNGNADNTETEEMVGATASVKASGVQLVSLISQVKDLLPQLSDKFIESCLKHYNYQTEDVINAVLEESLHPSLQKLNRSETKKVAKPAEPAPTILSQRRNIFDYDEFDVFHRDDVDVSKIHKGKRKSQHKDGKSLLDDKDEHLKSITRDYEFKVHLEENMHMYDDDYDDTYDDPIVGMEDDRTPDEILSLRPFTTPRVLEKKSRVAREKSSSSEDEVPEVEELSSTGRRLNFIEDPAVIRERLAARRGGHAGNRDVKGKPKGHGQEDNVVRNRAFKEKNKSFRGNHSRRAMADKKRQRGMIPS